MKLRRDKFGRIVGPKPMKSLGQQTEAELESVEQPDGVLLRPVGPRPSMIQMGGLWIHTGTAEPGAKCEHVLDEVREERMRAVVKR